MLKSILSHRNLLWRLVAAELKLKYKNTAIGFFWAMLEPLLIIGILLFVFSRLFKPDIDNYPAFLVIGFISWNFFSRGTSALTAFVGRRGLITKIKFPKEIVVISSCIAALITSIVEFIVLVFVLHLTGTKIGVTALLLPVLIVLEFIFILGVSLALSSLYVHFRDLSHIWRVATEAMFFATPIIYPNSLLLNDFPLLLMLNPMAHFITNYRRIILYGLPLTATNMLILCAISLFFLAGGYVLFLKLEPGMAEAV